MKNELEMKKGKQRYHAIALIEFNSVAAGIITGDAMVKKAPLTMLKAGTVHPGKYLVIIGGDVASVEEAYREGLNIRPESIIDQIILPDIHIQVHDAILGLKNKPIYEALSVLETSTVAANLLAADVAVKGAYVDILEIRLADGLGGNSFTLFNGKVDNVQTAIDLGVSAVQNKDVEIHTSVIPNIDQQMIDEICKDSRFFSNNQNDD